MSFWQSVGNAFGNVGVMTGGSKEQKILWLAVESAEEQGLISFGQAEDLKAELGAWGGDNAVTMRRVTQRLARYIALNR